MIYTEFADDVGSETNVITTEVTTGLWSPNETGSLSAVYTSSVQRNVSGEFYYDLYHLNADTDTDAEVQMSVAYGHINGGGSPTVVNLPTSTVPTKVIYSQYRNILLTSGSKFTFNNVQSDDIYVISINRARMKQSLDPGNWQLGLSGSNGLHTFIDSFGQSDNITGNVVASNVYEIRSGSLTTGTATYDSNNPTKVYGLVFPDYGAIILYPKLISESVGFVNATSAGMISSTPFPFAPWTGSVGSNYEYQHEGLYRSISSSMAKGNAFIARSVEEVASKNYSIYLRYDKYNYTNNPSYYTTATDGTREILPVFKENPLTYITTIGLYNSQNELLAVAKLSRPIQKSIDKAVLIRVRLDY